MRKLSEIKILCVRTWDCPGLGEDIFHYFPPLEFFYCQRVVSGVHKGDFYGLIFESGKIEITFNYDPDQHIWYAPRTILASGSQSSATLALKVAERLGFGMSPEMLIKELGALRVRHISGVHHKEGG